MDDVLIGLGKTGGVVHVPTEGFEEGVEVFLAKLGFVVLAGLAGVELLLEAGGQIKDFLRCVHPSSRKLSKDRARQEA